MIKNVALYFSIMNLITDIKKKIYDNRIDDRKIKDGKMKRDIYGIQSDRNTFVSVLSFHLLIFLRITCSRAIRNLVRIRIVLFAPSNGQLRKSSRYTDFFVVKGNLREYVHDSYKCANRICHIPKPRRRYCYKYNDCHHFK